MVGIKTTLCPDTDSEHTFYTLKAPEEILFMTLKKKRL